jgi:hypothetical protein
VELFQKLEQRLEVTLANQQSKGNMGIKAANLFVRVGECEKCPGMMSSCWFSSASIRS